MILTTLILSEKIWYQQNINNNPTFSRVFNPTFSQLMPEVPREILSSRKVEPPWMLGPWLNSIKIQRIYQYYWSYYWFLLICFQRFLYIYITLFQFGLPSTPWMIWMANLILEGQWSLILAKPRVQSSESSESSKRNPWWFPRSLKADVAVCLFLVMKQLVGPLGRDNQDQWDQWDMGWIMMDHDGSNGRDLRCQMSVPFPSAWSSKMFGACHRNGKARRLQGCNVVWMWIDDRCIDDRCI